MGELYTESQVFFFQICISQLKKHTPFIYEKLVKQKKNSIYTDRLISQTAFPYRTYQPNNLNIKKITSLVKWAKGNQLIRQSTAQIFQIKNGTRSPMKP